MTGAGILSWLVVLQVLAPATTLTLVGLPPLFGLPARERGVTRAVGAGFAIALAAALGSLAMLVARGFAPHHVHLGTWFHVGHHETTIDLVADALSIPYVCLSTGLCGLVNAFAGKYLHRETGFVRFFVLFALFGTGMNLLVLAGSIDVLFAGWECVGISSTLLIGFFHDRVAAATAALRAFVTYRVCDAGLLAAGVVLHAATGSGDFERAIAGSWPAGTCLLSPTTALVVALLLLFAALGKSGQVPFSGWLPRAMEGPTPSSAIFYGALSIHAGAYLLLRCEAILEATPVAAWLLVAIGAGTALHAALVGSVQTDLKGMLAYASMTQAGIIRAEIGLGWRIVPLVHVVSHAILRSPSALHDRHELAAALGGHPGADGSALVRLLPARARTALYHVALERGYEEALVQRLGVGPVLGALRAAARGERRVVGWLSGDGRGTGREGDR
jgi:NAD(P)H-quinone oxidoreductase subunit 5